VEELTGPPPAPDLPDLAGRGRHGDVVVAHGPLWRIYASAGEHAASGPEFRTWGPSLGGRFDPHPLPAGDTSGESVLYAATDLLTAVAEAFQETRRLERVARTPRVAAWEPTRGLRLLDLTGTWPMRAGAGGLINTGRRVITQQWARAIRERWPDLDGVLHRSSITQTPTCVTLWAPAADTIPATPELDRALSDAVLLPWLVGVCSVTGYELG
jgi:hypothetical protein